MDEIAKEIEAYDAVKKELEAEHMGKWVVFYGGKLIGVYETFEKASEEAIAKFGKGPYLIRQVGAPPMSLSASVVFHITHG